MVKSMGTVGDCSVMQRVAIVALGLFASGVCEAAPPKPKPRDPIEEGWSRTIKAAVADNLGEASAAARALWDLKPNDYQVACNIGRLEFRQNNYREAGKWYSRCMALFPKNP